MTVRKLVTLPDTLAAELENIAKTSGEKQGEIVANALDMYFDYLDAKEAEKQMQRIAEGKERVYSREEALELLNAGD